MVFFRWPGRRKMTNTFTSTGTNVNIGPLTLDETIQTFFSGTASIPRVTRAEALSVAAIARGRNMICQVATLPLQSLDSAFRPAHSPLLEQIDKNVVNVVTLAQTLEDLLFDGISWWQVTHRGSDGFPYYAEHLDVSRVSLQPPRGVSSVQSPLPSGEDPRGAYVWVDGRPVSWRNVIRFDSPNPGLLHVAGRAVKRAILLDKAAAMYADDPRPLDYFTPSDRSVDPVSDDTVVRILNRWRLARKKRSTAYVPAALAYNVVEQPTPADLQLVELQKQATLEIANFVGLDPIVFGLSVTSDTYQNAVEQRQDRINELFSSYMLAITQRLSMVDITRPGHTVHFNLDDYLRADPSTRASVHKTYLDMGATTVDEIRARERWSPLPAQDTSNASVQQPALEQDQVNAIAQKLLTFTFDAQHVTLTTQTPTQTFSVDTDKRTITGLALPYGAIAEKFGTKFRFRPNSLRWNDISRVKHFKDHTTPIGRALELHDSPTGLTAKLSVGRGPDGDRLLMEAEDGIYDGFSVGVDFNMESSDVQLTDDGVYDILRADLREVSTVATPAFDDARVTKVAASREGQVMTAPIGPQIPAVQALTQEQITAALAQYMQNVSTVAPITSTVQAPEGPGVVNPTRLPTTQSTFVREASPYRFDRRGNLQRGTHDFSTDLINAQRGDASAYDRAMEFVRLQFTDDISTDDVNELNPTRNRPDMYVDQLEYTTPLWNMINKGTLTDITPFTYPKFNASATLVSDHSEGTEPTAGTFTTTGSTVTPTALSGIVDVTRETWDQGGNPQISNLIWRQMQRAWNESLEASAATLLASVACTGTGSVLTAGVTDKTLGAAITSFIVERQFDRGGFRQTAFPVNKALYKALSSAVDDNGRNLYPAIGAANASGTAASRWASLNVNGLIAVPAWALTTSTTEYSNSYLFDPEDVSGWASAPQRLNFEYQVSYVHVGIWGYKATAGLRTCSAIAVMYDPTA